MNTEALLHSQRKLRDYAPRHCKLWCACDNGNQNVSVAGTDVIFCEGRTSENFMLHLQL